MSDDGEYSDADALDPEYEIDESELDEEESESEPDDDEDEEDDDGEGLSDDDDRVSIADSVATSTLGALDIRHKQKAKNIQTQIIVDPADHQFSDVVSCFEYTELIGTRATQLDNGEVPYVDVGNLIDTRDIAKLELYQRRCPIMIERQYLDGIHVEMWNPNEMILPYRLEQDLSN